MIGQRARGNALQAPASIDIAQPVETPCDPADECLVRVLHQPRYGEPSVHRRHGAFQLPACPGQDQQVVHETQITHALASGEVAVKLIQVKSGQQRAERTTTGDTGARLVKITPRLDAVEQELREQPHQDGILDPSGEQLQQLALVDMGVVTADVGLADKSVDAALLNRGEINTKGNVR